MVGGDNTSGWRDKEKGVSMFAGNFDVGFITCLSRVDRAFKLQIELMTIRSSIKSVVEDSLIRTLMPT